MWTMDELVERVREALAAEYSGATDGRVRDVPDRRAIRWYTTIGLVDRPLGMRGRTALYGPRHLQQLVAIKRRQAVGLSLSQIQGELSWVSDEALAELSRVPERLLETDELSPDHAANARHMRFWAQTPSEGRPPSIAAQPPPFGGAAETPSETVDAGGSGSEPATPTASLGAIGAPPVVAPRAGSATAAARWADSTTITADQPAAKATQNAKTAADHPTTPTAATPTVAATTTSEPTTTTSRPATSTSGPATATSRPASATAGPTTTTARPATATAGSATATAQPATSVSGVALRGGAILLVPHPVSDRDRDDIAAAAAPLLDLLEARGLIDGRSA